MPKKRKSRSATAVRTVAGEVRELNGEIRDGKVEEVVRRLEEMTEDRRDEVMTTPQGVGPEEQRKTVLETAVGHRLELLVSRLLRLGADANGNGRWMSPLEMAVRNDDGRTVEALLCFGARVQTPRTNVVEVGNNGGHDDSLSALLCWDFGDRHEVLQYIQGNVRCPGLFSVELLVQCDLVTDQVLVASWGKLPRGELEDALSLLLMLHVDVSGTLGMFGRTALGTALCHRDVSQVRLLLSSGVDPCVRDKRDMVPLDYVSLQSADMWDPLLLDLLLAGALAPPLLVLLSQQRKIEQDAEALSWLMQAGSCFGDLSEIGTLRFSEPFVFLNCQRDVLGLLWHVLGPAIFRFRDNKGRNLLHMFCECRAGLEDLVFLLERGMDPDDTDDEGISALYMAVCNQDTFSKTNCRVRKDTQFVDELLSFGSSLVLPGHHSGALQWIWDHWGELFEFEMLLERGADIGDLEIVGRKCFLESLSQHCYSFGPSVLRHFVERGSDLSLVPNLEPLHPHMTSVVRRVTPWLTDTDTIYLPCRTASTKKKKAKRPG